MSRDPKNRRECIRTKLNSVPLDHSRVEERRHKSPIELATGIKVNFYEELGIRDTIVLMLPD